MSDALMYDAIRGLRDAARADARFRLSEHLDDAMLLMASEAHSRGDGGRSGALPR